MNYVSLSKHITKLKKTSRHHWLKEATADVMTQKLIDLDTAYKNFFEKRAKFPKFKKKMHAQSIRYQLDQRFIMNNFRAGQFIKLPKLGACKLKWSQQIVGIPKMATVSKTASGKYFISFSCEVEQKPHLKTGRSIGLDFGVKDVVVTSEGNFSGAPKFTKKYQKLLRHENKSLARKTKGSANWRKQRLKLAKVHEKIANSRHDFLHKLSTQIVKDYDLICIEDLHIKGMVKNRRLSKALSDAGLGYLRSMIEYKSAWYGKDVSVIDRWFPSTKTCSGCGKIHEMKLKDRVMRCSCGLEMNRDFNAAINILRAGKALCGEVSSGAASHRSTKLPSVKQARIKNVDQVCLEQA